MKSHYNRQHGLWYHDKMHFHHYQDATQPKRCLLMLHGIRLGGVETWEPIIRYLSGWSDILVPEIPGVGALNPQNQTDHDFDLDMLLEGLTQLVQQHHWTQFDIMGYSYGGFLSLMLTQRLRHCVVHQIIFESALLVDKIENLHSSGSGLNKVADVMRTDAVTGNQHFSDMVFAKKPPRQFSLTTQKLKVYNPLGFANLISILTKIYLLPVSELWKIVDEQSQVTLLMTLPLAVEKKNMLQSIQPRCDWRVIYIDNADHAELLVNPERMAKLLISLHEESS